MFNVILQSLSFRFFLTLNPISFCTPPVVVVTVTYAVPYANPFTVPLFSSTSIFESSFFILPLVANFTVPAPSNV